MCEKSGIFNSNSVPTYRTRTITKKAYRTNIPFQYHYKKGVPYQRIVLRSKSRGVPYRTAILAGNDSLRLNLSPRHIRKGELIKRIIASHLCTAVGCQQFRKQSKNFKRKFTLNVIIPFSIIVCCLALRDAPKTYSK